MLNSRESFAPTKLVTPTWSFDVPQCFLYDFLSDFSEMSTTSKVDIGRSSSPSSLPAAAAVSVAANATVPTVYAQFDDATQFNAISIKFLQLWTSCVWVWFPQAETQFTTRASPPASPSTSATSSLSWIASLAGLLLIRFGIPPQRPVSQPFHVEVRHGRIVYVLRVGHLLQVPGHRPHHYHSLPSSVQWNVGADAPGSRRHWWPAILLRHGQRSRPGPSFAWIVCRQAGLKLAAFFAWPVPVLARATTFWTRSCNRNWTMAPLCLLPALWEFVFVMLYVLYLHLYVCKWSVQCFLSVYKLALDEYSHSCLTLVEF